MSIFEQPPQASAPAPQKNEGITNITVAGFKSISQQQSIEIRPLTILAEANSSGKSSMMQPLLLMKQTLEAPYDPGALLLNGPNVRFTSVDQVLSRIGNDSQRDDFRIGIGTEQDVMRTIQFQRSKSKGFDIEDVSFQSANAMYHLHPYMKQREMQAIFLQTRMYGWRLMLSHNLNMTYQNWNQHSFLHAIDVF